LEELYDDLKPGTNILFEGDLASRKEALCRLLVKQAIEENKPVGLISFNAKAHLAWLEENASKEALRNVLVRDSEMEINEYSLQLAELFRDRKIIFNDVFDILAAGIDPKTFAAAWADHLYKGRRLGIVQLFTADPRVAGEDFIARLRDMVDVIVSVEAGGGNSIIWKYAKHPTKEIGVPRQVLYAAGLPGKRIVELNATAMELEVFNALHYLKASRHFPKNESDALLSLAHASLNHAMRILNLIIESNEPKETATEATIIDELKLGLEEGLLMKERYMLYTEDLPQKELFSQIAEEEKVHEEIVKKLLEKHKPA